MFFVMFLQLFPSLLSFWGSLAFLHPHPHPHLLNHPPLLRENPATSVASRMKNYVTGLELHSDESGSGGWSKATSADELRP